MDTSHENGLLGWIDAPAEVAVVKEALPFPVFKQAAVDIRDTGKGRVVLPYLAEKAILGEYARYPAQTQGTCVGRGAAMATRGLLLRRIAEGAREALDSDVSSEAIYAGSRIEIGKGRLGRGQGSVGAWAAKWLLDYGTILRGRYGNIDLTQVNDELAQQWGTSRQGLPDELEPVAREHPVLTASEVRSYEEVRDALANAGMVFFCCNTIWGSRRDGKGFSRPASRGGHCIPIIGVDDDKEPSLLLDYRSWGQWGSGGKRHDQPDSTVWAYAEDVDRELSGGDSWAITDIKGWPRRPTDYFLL